MNMKGLTMILVILFLFRPEVCRGNIEDEIKPVLNWVRQGNYAEVEDYLERIWERNDPRVINRVYGDVVAVLAQRGDYGTKLKVVEEYNAKFPVMYPDYKSSNDLYVKHGYILFRIARYQEALISLENFIEGYAGSHFDYSAHSRIGELQIKHQRHEEAIEHLRWVIENSKSHIYYVPAKLHLIDAYLVLGKRNEALNLIEEGMEEFNKNNTRIDEYYLSFKVKAAKYYLTLKDWENFKRFNSVPFFKRRWEMGSSMYKLNRVYANRKNSSFLDAYISYSVFKHTETLEILDTIDISKLNLDQKLAVVTMYGVTYFWLGDHEKAEEYLLQGTDKKNFLVDEVGFYLAAINMNKGNAQEAKKYMYVYSSAGKSDLMGPAYILNRWIDFELTK